MRIADGIIYKIVGDEVVLLDYEQGMYYGLDAVGSRVWQLLAEGRDDTAIVDALLEEYDVDRETLTQDLERLLGELEAKGLVRRE